MRRAAVRVFRTARLSPSRGALRSFRGGFQDQSYVLSIRNASGRPEPAAKVAKALPSIASASSMYIRRFSVAVISGLVGYGAWYTYKGQSGDLTSSQQGREFSSTSGYSNPTQAAETTSEIERKAVIVGADTLYTGAITGEGPISKDTDSSGRKVLEMLTPEQATQKLRCNEESYFVGRGAGVVRYDVVQIPSNDPIEDDHAEKIVEVASPAAATALNPSRDWMFWGVFDGHA